MANIFNSIFRKITTSKEDKDVDQKDDKSAVEIGTGYAAGNTAYQHTQQAKVTFAKPETYAGNRTIYDSPKAKVNAKMQMFQDGQKVVDPYTNETLVLTKKEAKLLYGKDWTKHLAESDHVKPLAKIYEDTKGNVWNTTNDIRNAANSKDNIRVTSRNYNNAKRQKTNKQFVNDTEYLKNKGVSLTDEGKQRAIVDGDYAEKSITNQLRQNALKNAVKTGHEAGLAGAQDAGVTAVTMAGILNVVDVIQGRKTCEEALEDTVAKGGQAMATGYVMGNGLTVVSHTLSNSSSSFIQGLVESNVPGKVITAVLVTGDTLSKWGNGEISTQECILALGEKGLNLATMGYYGAVGQALIPIPIVGGAVGALVGSLLTSSYYHELINALQHDELFEHQERLRIIAECNEAAERTKAYRKELEEYLESYLSDYRECFDMALSSMRFAWAVGDADGMIKGANDITRKLGGKVYFDSVDEFCDFLASDKIHEF